MRVGILGAGLIGGSVALGLCDREGYEVAVHDPAAEAREAMAERAGGDVVVDSLEAAVAGADLVFICAPVSAIAPTASRAAEVAPEGCVLTDVGSTKRNLVAAIDQGLLEGRHFIGGHPMAGSEEAGAFAARGNLFEGAHWILTPTDRSDGAAYERVHEVVTALGARVVSLDPKTHDSLMAVVSHVPQLMASALMDMATEATSDRPDLLTLAGKGFKDMTRLAASNPRIWLDVCEQNSEEISRVLAAMSSRLEGVADTVATGGRGDLESLLTRARAGRRGLKDKPAATALQDILVPIPDRPGVLALVTTTIGNLGINIEDIAIVHGVDGARGVLTVSIAGERAAERVVAALESGGLIAESLPR